MPSNRVEDDVYLHRSEKGGQPIQNRVISAIKTSVNTDARRPDKVNQNAWANFHWWLQNEFSDMRFSMDTTTDVVKALTIIRASISNGWPVLVSTNRNMHSSGHIILVVGVMQLDGSRLLEPVPGPVGQNLAFICHDPYGRFGVQFYTSDPRWGKNRYDMPGGYSTPGGEIGPGMSVCYPVEGISRSGGTFLLIRAS